MQQALHTVNQIVIDGLSTILLVLFAIEVAAKVTAYTFRETSRAVREAREK